MYGAGTPRGPLTLDISISTTIRPPQEPDPVPADPEGRWLQCSRSERTTSLSGLFKTLHCGRPGNTFASMFYEASTHLMYELFITFSDVHVITCTSSPAL